MKFLVKAQIEKSAKAGDLAGLAGFADHKNPEMAALAKSYALGILAKKAVWSDAERRVALKWAKDSNVDVRRLATKACLARGDARDAAFVDALIASPEARDYRRAVMEYFHVCAHSGDPAAAGVREHITHRDTLVSWIDEVIDRSDFPLIELCVSALDLSGAIDDPQFTQKAVEIIKKAHEDPKARLTRSCLASVARVDPEAAVPLMLNYLTGAPRDTQRVEDVTAVTHDIGADAVPGLIAYFDNYRRSIRSQDQNGTNFESREYLASLIVLQLLIDVAPPDNAAAERLLGDIVADTKFSKTGRHTKLAREAWSRRARKVG
ncbi:MAG: hypothetical protein H6684_14705 [Deltaproteobacteria bacterium]|nr:hypothetical protein [bacterium]MCB9476925.1 hypothetical protein [Deltaproteobacteria bacterium]MCB9489980.1 hypothetical protein [Deltaproteobacteria bacterium]